MDRLFLTISFILISICTLVAQPLSGSKFLQYNQSVPKDLLSSKVLVLVSTADSDSTDPKDWMAYADSIHNYFRKIGIESTGYYYFDDVFASNDAQKSYFKKVLPRDVDYICHVNYKRGLTDLHQLIITKFNGKDSFISHGQDAYSIFNEDFLKLMVSLAKAVKSSGQSSNNFLIEDEPEVIHGLVIDGGKKLLKYNVDLKVSKLAVPKFKKITIPTDKPFGAKNDVVAMRLEKYNNNVASLNVKLESIMKNYPYPYEIVDFDMTERDFFNKGYQFILMQLAAKNSSAKSMLQVSEEVKSSNPSLKGRDVITKFYIKQLFTKDSYIGATWDAETNWEDALSQHINNLTNFITGGQ